MNKKAWLCVIFGLGLAALIDFATAFDVSQVLAARETISRWALGYGAAHPWFPFVLTLFGVGSVMTLATHLWFKTDWEHSGFPFALLGALAGVVVGVVIGMLEFMQKG
jgi:hypothetical protein